MVFPLAVTDKEITELLKGVNCVPKKFMHGDTANHVWFWSIDNKAKKEALDMAYKIKGHYKDTTNKNGNTYNTQVNIYNDKALQDRIAQIKKEIIQDSDNTGKQ